MLDSGRFSEQWCHKELVVRKQIMREFTKTRNDFGSLSDFNNYLETLEDFIWKLACGDESVWEKVNAFRALHCPSDDPSHPRLGGRPRRNLRIRIGSDAAPPPPPPPPRQVLGLSGTTPQNQAAPRFVTGADAVRMPPPPPRRPRPFSGPVTPDMIRARKRAAGWRDEWWLQRAVQEAFQF